MNGDLAKHLYSCLLSAGRSGTYDVSSDVGALQSAVCDVTSTAGKVGSGATNMDHLLTLALFKLAYDLTL